MVWQSDYSVSSLSEKESRERERELDNLVIKARRMKISKKEVSISKFTVLCYASKTFR